MNQLHVGNLLKEIEVNVDNDVVEYAYIIFSCIASTYDAAVVILRLAGRRWLPPSRLFCHRGAVKRGGINR